MFKVVDLEALEKYGFKQSYTGVWYYELDSCGIVALVANSHVKEYADNELLLNVVMDYASSDVDVCIVFDILGKLLLDGVVEYSEGDSIA